MEGSYRLRDYSPHVPDKDFFQSAISPRTRRNVDET